MLLIPSYKHEYYLRFRIDIWGFLLTNTNLRTKFRKRRFRYFRFKNWVLKFFWKIEQARVARWLERTRRYIYRIDINVPRKRIKKLKRRFVSVRLTRLHFLTLREHHFRRIFIKSSFLDGNLEDNFLHAIEGRLLAFLYRCNFFKNIYEILDIIKSGVITVDEKVIKFYNYKVPIGKFVTISRLWHPRLKFNWKKRTRHRSWLFPTPKFIFISFHFKYAYLISLPKKKLLVYPFRVDIQRLTGYY